MRTRLILPGLRSLMLASLEDPLDGLPPQPFATMIPAFTEEDLARAKAITRALVKGGSVQLCCVGPLAERLHDELDALLEDDGSLDVVTTEHTDIADACEYFLHAAGGVLHALVALVAAHPEVVAQLELEARRE